MNGIRLLGESSVCLNIVAFAIKQHCFNFLDWSSWLVCCYWHQVSCCLFVSWTICEWSDLDTRGHAISGVMSIRSAPAVIDIRETIDHTEEEAGADRGGQAVDLGLAQGHGTDSGHHRWWGCGHRCVLIRGQGQSQGHHLQPYRIRLHRLLSGRQRGVGDAVGMASKCFSWISSHVCFFACLVIWIWWLWLYQTLFEKHLNMVFSVFWASEEEAQSTSLCS